MCTLFVNMHTQAHLHTRQNDVNFYEANLQTLIGLTFKCVG